MFTLLCLGLGLVAGCTNYTKLQPQQSADLVKISTIAGFPELPRKEIGEKEQVAKLVSFVNSLPNRWNVPWYSPPVGQINFEFYADKKMVGRFYVGTFFFGRDGGNFWSQNANRTQIEELSKIVGLDIWAYLNGEKP